MAEQDGDLDLGHLFRVIILQGGQVALGTAIGLGVLLLVGIVGVLLAPVVVPILLYRHVRRRRAAAAAGQDVSDLVAGGGGTPPPPV